MLLNGAFRMGAETALQLALPITTENTLLTAIVMHSKTISPQKAVGQNTAKQAN